MTNMQMPKIRQDYYPLTGGLDLVTPAIAINPGSVIDSQNYEPAIGGGYRRVDGFEAFDGHASPTAAAYTLLPVVVTGTVAVGNTVTGATSAATGVVLAVITGNLVLGRVTGTFTASENLTVAAVVQAHANGLQALNGSSSPSDNADYALLAANDQRTQIAVVPGSGQIRGVWVYNDIVYAFRDNAGATAGTMWKSSAAGWVQVTFGSEISFTALTTSSTVTITIATPGVVSYAAHPFINGQPVSLTTTGALPTGLTAGLTYYVVNQAAGTFQLAASVGGTAINTTGSQSGTHTCTAIGNAITAGQTITGVTSGATATVKAALLRTGSWTVAPVGTLVLTGITGTFQSGEAITVASLYVTKTSSLATAITRAAGGRLEFCNYNFTGSTVTTRMYGCDGVNPAFEFDGTTYVPIHTGMTADTPTHIIAHKAFLFLSFLASVQYSGIGNPYAWTVVLGAGEISTSTNVSGFITQSGNSISGSTLGIFTAERPLFLYGTSSADFRLVTSNFDVGYLAYTAQQVSNDSYGMTSRGIQALGTTQAYGDFVYASVSHMIQPLITAKRGLTCASNTLRTKNQYRVYFTDNTALAVGLTGDKISGIMPLNYGMPVRCIVTATLTTGAEATYFGSDDGFVYQDNVGTSQNGSAIESWIRLPFNNDKSPRVRKRFRRAVHEMVAEGYAQVNISYDLGYSNPDVQPSAPMADSVLVGAGGYWDHVIFDQFTWDTQSVANPSTSLEGTETNISMLYYSSRAQDSSHTISGLTLISSPRVLSRA